MSRRGNSGGEGIQVGLGGRLSLFLLLLPTAWPLCLECLTSFCNRESKAPQKVVVILCQLCTFRIEAVVIHVIASRRGPSEQSRRSSQPISSGRADDPSRSTPPAARPGMPTPCPTGLLGVWLGLSREATYRGGINRVRAQHTGRLLYWMS